MAPEMVPYARYIYDLVLLLRLERYDICEIASPPPQ